MGSEMNGKKLVLAGCYVAYKALLALFVTFGGSIHAQKSASLGVPGVIGLLIVMILIFSPSILLGVFASRIEKAEIHLVFYNSILVFGALLYTILYYNIMTRFNGENDSEFMGSVIAFYLVFLLGLELIIFNSIYLIRHYLKK